ncbi:hypothetical protein [Streptomyces resistomycificus]|uniref:Uncharacterized protein n=1 Tax=Streptomyces resistomycificus TaxID=67356 RepID=A0A0L8KU09_9ACTN|nr:hypothetical protein [Streptomyces resistomycificus]KOG29350.1 hypothetical protein ADK37_37230 [Streptomyces resistomycificus]KUO01684.1 hypothetical protein AQJ84_04430 [Streptomyces resistomycificus]
MCSPDRAERVCSQLDSARRHLDTFSSRTGRVATADGVAAATAGLFTPEVTGAGLVFLPTRRATKFKEVKVVTEHHDGMQYYLPGRVAEVRLRAGAMAGSDQVDDTVGD